MTNLPTRKYAEKRQPPPGDAPVYTDIPDVMAMAHEALDLLLERFDLAGCAAAAHPEHAREINRYGRSLKTSMAKAQATYDALHRQATRPAGVPLGDLDRLLREAAGRRLQREIDEARARLRGLEASRVPGPAEAGHDPS